MPDPVTDEWNRDEDPDVIVFSLGGGEPDPTNTSVGFRSHFNFQE